MYGALLVAIAILYGFSSAYVLLLMCVFAMRFVGMDMGEVYRFPIMI
jgi:hypothetical protein